MQVYNENSPLTAVGLTMLIVRFNNAIVLMRLINVVGRISPFGTIRTDRSMWSSLKKVLPHLTKLFRDVFQVMVITDNVPVSVLLAGMSEISLRSKRLIFCEISRFFGKFDFVNTHVGEQHPPEKNHARTSFEIFRSQQ